MKFLQEAPWKLPGRPLEAPWKLLGSPQEDTQEAPMGFYVAVYTRVRGLQVGC